MLGTLWDLARGREILLVLHLSCRLMVVVARMKGILVFDKPVFKFWLFHLLAG